MEVESGQMNIHYFGISMVQLATMWPGQEGSPALDKMGLKGQYDFKIHKTAHVGSPPSAQPEASGSDSEPSIFLLAEELGLELEPGKGQIEILVIDHVERLS